MAEKMNNDDSTESEEYLEAIFADMKPFRVEFEVKEEADFRMMAAYKKFHAGDRLDLSKEWPAAGDTVYCQKCMLNTYLCRQYGTSLMRYETKQTATRVSAKWMNTPMLDNLAAAKANMDKFDRQQALKKAAAQAEIDAKADAEMQAKDMAMKKAEAQDKTEVLDDEQSQAKAQAQIPDDSMDAEPSNEQAKADHRAEAEADVNAEAQAKLMAENEAEAEAKAKAASAELAKALSLKIGRDQNELEKKANEQQLSAARTKAVTEKRAQALSLEIGKAQQRLEMFGIEQSKAKAATEAKMQAKARAEKQSKAVADEMAKAFAYSEDRAEDDDGAFKIPFPPRNKKQSKKDTQAEQQVKDMAGGMFMFVAQAEEMEKNQTKKRGKAKAQAKTQQRSQADDIDRQTKYLINCPGFLLPKPSEEELAKAEAITQEIRHTMAIEKENAQMKATAIALDKKRAQAKKKD